MATQAQALKQDLKKAFPGNKFSVRGDHNSIRVSYTDGPGLTDVESIANQYKKVSYCAYSGEILSGGNTFVNVSRSFSEEMKNSVLDAMELNGQPRIQPNDYNEYFWWQKTYNAFVNQESSKIDPLARMEELEAIAKELEDQNNGYITIEAKTVINPVQIEIKPFFGVAKFAVLNKNNTMAEYQGECDKPEFSPDWKHYPNWRMESIKVIEHWTMTDSDYDEFINNLLCCNLSIEFMNGKGGSDSRCNKYFVNNVDSDKWSSLEWEMWRKESYRIVLAVSSPNRDVIVVDPSGYSYARYVGLVIDQDAMKGNLMDKAILVAFENLPEKPLAIAA